MAAPNIDSIAASLRRCSLGGEGGGGGHSPPRPPRAPHLAEASDDSYGRITVDLNSETTIPYHWEQHLDIRTGEIYYINWETGERTTKDPRTACTTASTYSSSEDKSDVGHSCSRAGSSGDESDDDEDVDNDSDTSDFSGPSTSWRRPASGGETLVTAGCKACFTYFMVPTRVRACPNCGRPLLHLGRNGRF
ncbi:hypothetical protein Cni_G06198 [Canna indica]|uniref:WW domain-containing protein n=1 Tax=Canna indica TaxID=4628 RepID=A0AAQ3K102_9LILI|nr:hypothetical protein Cni_G06198 [Canna indica]